VRRLGSGIAAVALVCALAAPGAATAAKRGEVGGPPTEKSRFQPKGEGRALSDPIVVARGPSAVGTIELVAQKRRNQGLCVYASFLKLRGGLGVDCLFFAPFEGAIEAFHWGWARKWGVVSGSAVPADVASVTVRIERDGRATTVPALFAKPDASILQRLGTGPFAYFYAAYRGCAPPHKIVAEAHDAAGAVIGRSRGFKPPKGFGNPCRKDKR
jgi:hypothetical protein